MSEQRRFPRVDRLLLVNYDRYSAANLQDDQGMARTLDMSVRGMLLQMPHPIETGSKLRLTLNLDGDVVEVFGHVIRCQEDEEEMFQVGVELDYVPEGYIDRVEKFFGGT